MERQAELWTGCYVILPAVTKLLEKSIRRLSQFPTSVRDKGARAILRRLEKTPEHDDGKAIAVDRSDIDRGDFVTLEQWRNDVRLG